MIPSTDERLPVRFAAAATAGPDDALLVEGEAPVAAAHAMARFRLGPSLMGHPAGCACCTPRGPVAEALGRLFLSRARGDVTFFRSVLAVTATRGGEAAVRAALAEDHVSAARFRLADPS